jgi:hypothetical protein
VIYGNPTNIFLMQRIYSSQVLHLLHCSCLFLPSSIGGLEFCTHLAAYLKTISRCGAGAQIRKKLLLKCEITASCGR